MKEVWESAANVLFLRLEKCLDISKQRGDMKKKTKRIIGGVLLLLVIVGAAAAYIGYQLLYASNFPSDKTTYVYINEETNFDDLSRQLQDSSDCIRPSSFQFLAKALSYPEHMRTGKYAVDPGSGNLQLLNKLRRGSQSPVQLTFNNIRLKTDLAKRLSDQLMLAEEDLLERWNNPAYCDSLGFDTVTIITLFIPNTYEVYWNTSTDGLMKRMSTEYERFWNDERREKANQINLSLTEVAILASIVEEETAKRDEYARVSGLYINRLMRGMPLQADPTVKFAVGDFTLRRILFKHLEIDSPYNTYMYEGLPPGPLRVPSPAALDAVLNYERHNYLYMTANEDFSGYHNFAVTLAEHSRNAMRYQAELNRRGIRR